jgi:single-stranded DNA-binding protein
MSFYHNQVQLSGRVARPPESYTTSDGTAKVSLHLLLAPAPGRPDREADGFNLVAWGNLGNRLFETVKQGDRLFIQGRLRNRRFKSNGITHLRTEVHLDHFALLKSARGMQRIREQRTALFPGQPPSDAEE